MLRRISSRQKRLFNRMTAAEYSKASSNRLRAISIPYSDLVKALGEPHKNGEPDFPIEDIGLYSVYYNNEVFFNKLSKIVKLTPERIFA